jgi:hypothetical protein
MQRGFRHNGMTTLTRAGQRRLADARALAQRGEAHARGAMYLAGYAVECRIKARAIEQHRCLTLDHLCTKLRLSRKDVYSHDLSRLVVLLFSRETLARLASSPRTGQAWSRVAAWSSDWRYDSASTTQRNAEQFLDDVRDVKLWIESNL